MPRCGFADCFEPETSRNCSLCNNIAHHVCSNEHLATLRMEHSGQFCSKKCASTLQLECDAEMDAIIASVDLENMSQFSFPSVASQNVDSVPSVASQAQNETTTPFDTNMEFVSVGALITFLKEHGSTNGYSFHTQKFKKEQIYFRGNVQCSFKGAKQCKYTCPFRATFCRDQNNMFKFTKYNFEHNHELCEAKCDRNVKFKTKAEQITEAERVIIRNYCSSMDAYHLKLLMRTTFDIDYSDALIHNLVQRSKLKKKNEENPLEDLLQYGKKFD
jgi:hypothetical protein